jgi:hypothetical protein
MIANQLAIASVSLGQHSSHSLPLKVIAAAQGRFSGLEITYPDLESYAATLSTPILEAARQISDLCKAHGIFILALVSFQNFKGNKSPLEKRLKEEDR